MARFLENPVQMRQVPLQHAFNHVRGTCRDIQRSARVRAHVDRSPYRKPGPHLNRSINSTVRITSPTKVVGHVGSELNHALVHHEGARPHIIVPRGGNRLRFFWEKRGRWVSMTRVRHPGHDSNPYLTLPLLIIGTERGFVVVLVKTPF
jgi:hypothetical protein